MFTRRHLLRSLLPGLALPLVATRSTSAPRLVVVFARGGWDTSFVLDPKPSSPWVDGPEVDEVPGVVEDREELGTFGDLTVGLNAAKRPAVTRFFERWGRQTLIVRGIDLGSVGHEPCRRRILTGGGDPRRADLPTLVGAQHGQALPVGVLDLGGLSFAGPHAALHASTGENSQLVMLLDEARGYPPAEGETASPLAVSAAEEALVDRFLDQRLTLLEDRFQDSERSRALWADQRASWDRAAALRAQASPLLEGLRLGIQPTLNEQVDLAVALLGGGTAAAVSLLSRDDWDTHAENHLQHGFHNTLFSAIHRLVTGLEGAGLLDQTLVAVLSEMGRTPRLGATRGKDHWPSTSALLIGGGVGGGRALGGTTDALEAAPIDLGSGAVRADGPTLGYASFVAGLLELLQVDPGTLGPGVVPLRGLR